ncbi:MAG: ComEC/Rec2 family competence protein [Christensenellaceae bacterium]
MTKKSQAKVFSYLKKNRLSLILVALFILFFCSSFFLSPKIDTQGMLHVVYIDVEQGDATLIVSPNGKTMLIDTGEADMWEQVSKTLTAYGISQIDVFLCTHPHADHAGGLLQLSRRFPIKKAYLPIVPAENEQDIALQDVLQARNIPFTFIQEYTEISFDEVCRFEIFGLSKTYKETNNYSLVSKLTYQNNTFLFTGDAEKEAEGFLIEAYGDALQAQIWQLGHHGSNTSNSEAFLQAVQPAYAVVSCGLAGSSGHPHGERLALLNENNIPLFRTDLQGNITLISDGTTIRTAITPEVPTPLTENFSIVYKTPSGGTYHRASCDVLSESTLQISRKEATSAGLEACKKCFKH